MINRDSSQTYQTEKTQQDLNQQLVSSENVDGNEIVPVPAPVKQRLNSLDILRGLTMFGMILVDNSGPYPPWFLDHAEWNGLTPADLIFPSFVFIMGMAVPLAMSKNNPFGLRSLLRIIGLFAIGVLLNLTSRKFTFNHFRIMGILQRISLCYGTLAIIHFITRYGDKAYRFIGTLIVVSLGLVYLVLMVTFEKLQIGCPHQKNLSQFCNFGAYADRAMFGQFHMIYPNDPQGLFTTLATVLNAYAGYHFCLIMMDNKNQISKIMKLWILTSLLYGVMVYPLTLLMPLNKKIWSISFVFLTSAVSGLSLTFITYFVDVLGGKHPRYGKVINVILRPFIWLGRNPLAVFVLMIAVDIFMIKYIFIDGKSMWAQFYHYVFATWISNKQVCSTIFSMFWVILWTVFAGVLYRFKVFIRL